MSKYLGQTKKTPYNFIGRILWNLTTSSGTNKQTNRKAATLFTGKVLYLSTCSYCEIG